MRERPIIFSGPMVRAILAGTKTQTRRVVSFREFQPCTTVGWDWDFRDRRGLWNSYTTAQLIERKSPYGAPGDRLWVREGWGYRGSYWSSENPKVKAAFINYRADDERRSFIRVHDDDSGLPNQVCRCSGEGDELDRQLEHQEELRRFWKAWRPSIHMPRWASRLLLEVTAVRVERLQDIDNAGIQAEGVDGLHPQGGSNTAQWRERFVSLWDTINGKRAPWASNPWVWVIEFQPPVKETKP